MLLCGCSVKNAPEGNTAEAGAENTKPKIGTVEYENGDHLYIPGEDEMAFDEEAYVIFCENLLSVYTFETLTEKQIEALCKEADGELAGQISGAINMLQLKVDAADHGTHVAGLIAAQNNEIGIRGIADTAELYCVD